MLDYPKLDLELKRGGRVKKLKQKRQDLKNPVLTSKTRSLMKQKQKQTQRQVVNVNIGNKGTKKSYVRRNQQPQPQRNIMNYPPAITTIIQNPNQPQQLPQQAPTNNLPDMMALIRGLNLRGPRGEQGIQGIMGALGPEGPQGIQGLTGPQGIQGEMGLRGYRGEQGIAGIKGDIGNQGIQGERGDRGRKGEKGDKGNQGLQGDKGEMGFQGNQGVRGDRGERGFQGNQGIRGETGQSGVYYPTLEELELQQYMRTKYYEEKALEETKKKKEDEATKNFRENYLEDDFNNLNIRDEPMNNPLLDNPSLPAREEKEREVKEQPLLPPPVPPPLREVEITKTKLSKKTLPELIKIAIDNNLYNFTTKGKQGVSMGGKTIRQMTAKELRKIIYDANLPDSKIYP